jgi:hypothetical protein
MIPVIGILVDDQTLHTDRTAQFLCQSGLSAAAGAADAYKQHAILSHSSYTILHGSAAVK